MISSAFGPARDVDPSWLGGEALVIGIVVLFNVAICIAIVWWMLRVLKALEDIARSTAEGREFTRQLGVAVTDVKRKLTD